MDPADAPDAAEQSQPAPKSKPPARCKVHSTKYDTDHNAAPPGASRTSIDISEDAPADDPEVAVLHQQDKQSKPRALTSARIGARLNAGTSDDSAAEI